MSFYRKITRERTLCSFRDFSTNDRGLKQSFSSFTKPLRQAVFYKSFQIQNDYFKTGVDAKHKNEKSANDVYYSDSDKSNSRETQAERVQDDEKSSSPKERKVIGKSWDKNTSERCWFEKESNESNGINSSYDTYVSSNVPRDKERYEVMNEDLESNFSKTTDTDTTKSYFSERSNES